MDKRKTKDNIELLNLQSAYLSEPSDKNFGALWLKSLEVTKRLVEKECKKKHLEFSDEYKQTLTEDAVFRILQRYQKYKAKGKTYKLTNFVYGLYFGVLWSMYSDWRQRENKEDSHQELKTDITFSEAKKL